MSGKITGRIEGYSSSISNAAVLGVNTADGVGLFAKTSGGAGKAIIAQYGGTSCSCSGGYAGCFCGGKGVKIEGDLNVTGRFWAGDLIPRFDNYYWLGMAERRWARIYAVNTHFGDVNFANNFTITEAKDENALYFLNQKGEKIMKLDEHGNLFVKGKIIENFDFGE